MKKSKLLVVILLLLLLVSCESDPRYLNLKTKPNNHYYTNEIYNRLENKKNVSIQIFDTNSYEYYPVEESEEVFLLDFIDSLDLDSFKEEIETPNTPRFKLIIKFDDCQYAANIYDNELVTIYPWDGVFPEDKISMSVVPKYYNLYEFCDYTTKKALGQLP